MFNNSTAGVRLCYHFISECGKHSKCHHALKMYYTTPRNVNPFVHSGLLRLVVNMHDPGQIHCPFVFLCKVLYAHWKYNEIHKIHR